jgi:hypothetical protein
MIHKDMQNACDVDGVLFDPKNKHVSSRNPLSKPLSFDERFWCLHRKFAKADGCSLDLLSILIRLGLSPLSATIVPNSDQIAFSLPAPNQPTRNVAFASAIMSAKLRSE